MRRFDNKRKSIAIAAAALVGNNVDYLAIIIPDVRSSSCIQHRFVYVVKIPKSSRTRTNAYHNCYITHIFFQLCFFPMLPNRSTKLAGLERDIHSLLLVVNLVRLVGAWGEGLTDVRVHRRVYFG